MRTPKAFDWIIGYVYSDFERKLAKYLKEENRPGYGFKLAPANYTLEFCNVPKVCFGLREWKSTENTIPENDGARLCQAINKELEEVFSRTFNTQVEWLPENQYIAFRLKASRKEPPKKLTLKQIEEILGYEVEIIK